MNLVVEIDARELHAAMVKAPTKVKAGLNTWVTKTTLLTEREVKQEIPPHVDTGQLLNSVHSRIGDLKGEVTPTAKHAIYVDRGRRPGRMPPFQEGTALNSWAKRKGMNPFLVARSIAKKGIKKHPFMEKAYSTVKPRAEREGQTMLNEVMRVI